MYEVEPSPARFGGESGPSLKSRTAMTDGCPIGELLAAILGTFFGTLLFCFVLALLLVLVYRRHQQRSMAAQRIAGRPTYCVEFCRHTQFLPARRCASTVLALALCPSVCLSQVGL